MAQKDLIPFNQRSKDEVKRLNRKGGINSGIARRKKKIEQKTAQQIVQAFFGEEKELATGRKITNKEFMLLNAIKRTVNSILSDNGHRKPLRSEDLKAVEYFLSLVGEAPIPRQINELEINKAPVVIVDDIYEEGKRRSIKKKKEDEIK